MRRVEAIIQPELLVWARESAGLAVEEAAKKVAVKPERLQSWERGELRPSINQLRRLAEAYKRPLAVFYLPRPPVESPAPHDFRRFREESTAYKSPHLRFAIRQARYRRDVALELFEATEGAPPDFPLSATPRDDAERLAGDIRQLLGITYEEQTGWRDPYEAFNRWRSALEDAGILIFQAPRIDPQEMRAFSIGERPLPAIVLNSKDSVHGRIFSMLHEVSHLVLHEGGICNDFYEERGRPLADQRIEVFCNRVAGAVLVPEERLLAEQQVVSKRRKDDWSNDEIELLASRYRVSREVVLRRLLVCDRITPSFYEEKRAELKEEYEGLPPRREGGFVPPHRMAISTAGHLFTRLVLTNYYQDRITASDVSELLNVKLNHLGKIETQVFGRSVPSRATF